ncbi:MAG: hypothetical protein C0616_00990 [Desulfuromonas sp.]|nr:MAG: hypothetical protein C0616_00990 [Desulfuromonas sp.]
MVRIVLACSILAASVLLTQPAVATEPVPVHFFTAPNCPHCAEARPVLENLVEQQPAVVLHEYDIWNDPDSFTLLRKLVDTHGKHPLSTPAIFIGDRMWLGFNASMKRPIENVLASCIATGCSDPLQRLNNPPARAKEPIPPSVPAEAETITLPLLGEVKLEHASLPLMTVTLGLLDSINPCAFFVLLFLLGLLVHAHSRGRMLLIGGVFVLFSGIIYFLFMAAWLNLFLVVGRIALITTVAALIALIAAVINIKDFFFFKQGVSLTLSEESRSHLGKKIRHLVHAASLPAAIGGTVVLAVAANSYELLCTAGFPMVFTRILTLQELSTAGYYGYLAAYNIIYILPLLVIVTVFSWTLGVHKLSEWQGRELKLVSGMMMLILGLTLLLQPALLHKIWGAAGMLGLALLVSALIILLYKRSHPLTEQSGSRFRKLPH